MIGRALCALGLHSWSFVAWADAGRGRLEKCARKACTGGLSDGPATRRVPVPFSRVEEVIKEESARLRTRRRPTKREAEVDRLAIEQVERDLQRIIEDEDTDVLPIRLPDALATPTGVLCCASCRRPIYAFHVSRCPRCGAEAPKDKKKEKP